MEIVKTFLIMAPIMLGLAGLVYGPAFWFYRRWAIRNGKW